MKSHTPIKKVMFSLPKVELDSKEVSSKKDLIRRERRDVSEYIVVDETVIKATPENL
jgi:hypothetical protein